MFELCRDQRLILDVYYHAQAGQVRLDESQEGVDRFELLTRPALEVREGRKQQRRDVINARWVGFERRERSL